MGFTIEIYEKDFKHPTGSSGLSYNFSKYKNYWYLPDIGGHKSDIVARTIEDALKKLRLEGIVCSKNLQGKSGWGSEKYSEKENKEVFGWHLLRLLDICKENPDGYWYIDREIGKDFYGVKPCEFREIVPERPVYCYMKIYGKMKKIRNSDHIRLILNKKEMSEKKRRFWNDMLLIVEKYEFESEE